MDVMIVEDDAKLLEVLQHHVVRAGYQTRTAPNGEAALLQLQERAADIVITDWKMPRMDGVQLCRAIRSLQQLRQTYIIMLTGQASEDEQLEGIHAGADDYLTKPFQMSRLLASVRIAVQMIRQAAA